MNSPREFCRLFGAHTSILLTYNFDALFFERVVINDLWAGATGDVLVMADPGQVAAAAETWDGQLKYLGRRYQLIPAAATTGAFHPKVILRLGAQGGYVWLGSGNVSHGGWAGNRELCAAWQVGPGHADNGAWVAGLLEQVSAWSPTAPSHDVARRASEIPWVREAAGAPSVVPADRALLTSFGGDSLAARLRRRWAGRRFTEARILTGSTDESGAQLRWLAESFGVERATVILDQRRASFRPDKLMALPLEARVLHLPGRPVHAKLYWLDGPDGAAALFGSANCSAAAWLPAPAEGGNVEAVVVYERPEAADFAPVLGVFDSEELTPAELRPGRAADDRPPPTPPGPSISEVVWDEGLGEVRVTLRGAAGVEEVTLAAGGETVDLRPAERGAEVWGAELPELFGEGETNFVLVEVRLAGGGASRLRCWVNDLGELRHAARGRRFADAINGLASPQLPGGQQKIVEDHHLIQLALLSESEAFPDPPAGPRGAGGAPAPDLGAIRPDEFIVSINDLRRERGGTGAGHLPAGLSLSGVMSALFGVAEADAEAEFEEEPDPDEPDNGGDAVAGVRAPIPTAPQRAPAAPNAERFRRNMGEFIARMSQTDFAARCTATQLVQATAYPLAVAASGRQGGWVDDETALVWVRRVSDLLFTKRYGGAALLSAVKSRYEAEGRGDDFYRVVGDGTLWLALLASLGGGAWEGHNAGFERAYALRATYGARELIAAGDPGRLGILLDRLGERQVRAVLEEAPGAAALLDALEGDLRGRWDSLTGEQKAARPTQRPGDLLWHPRAGWAEVLEKKEWGANFRAYLRSKAAEITAKTGFYLNVIRAAEADAALAARLRELGGGGDIG